MPKGKRRRASGQNRAGMTVIALVVVLLIVVMLIQCTALNRKIKTYAAVNEALETEIQEEKDRAQEIKNLPEYITSDEYAEKVAREKFGLVYPDEIIFKAEK